MKYMKLGTKADTFYTEQATRTVHSDVPTDIVIQINNTKFILHKFPLVQKCGLLQHLCSTSSSTTTSSSPIILHDFPSDEQSFELCAKYCYNISITLSAHNFLPTFSAASFLIMSDSFSSPNLLSKLSLFFHSFILPNWKDCILTLSSSSSTLTSAPFSDQSIITPLLDSIVSKILTPTSKVSWSFTYSRNISKSSVPKDWWTEDVAELDFSHFRTIIMSVSTSKTKLPPALLGEALHVYTVKNLLNNRHLRGNDRKVLEGIVSLIPNVLGAVSGSFLMKLLKIAFSVNASSSTMEELVKRVGMQLDEVTIAELESVGLGVVEAVVESFFQRFMKERREEKERLIKVSKLFDEYLVVVARKEELSVEKFMELAELVPRMAREEHDGLYRAIDTFLQVRAEMSKVDRRRLCRMIDCGKVSREVRTEAITNDRLPLRMLVQLLFAEQERANRGSRNPGNSIA